MTSNKFGMGHHKLGIHRLRGVFHGDDASRRNPFVVLRLGNKRSQTKALKVSNSNINIQTMCGHFNNPVMNLATMHCPRYGDALRSRFSFISQHC